MDKKGKEKFPLKPHSSVTLELELYRDINIIFGDKGTGKTEMLKSLEQYMKNNNYNVVTYYGNEKDSEFEAIIQQPFSLLEKKLLWKTEKDIILNNI